MIPQANYRIIDYEKFEPSAKGLFQPPYYELGGRGYFSCYQNVTQGELKAGIYKPRLTLTKRVVRGGYHMSLRVDLSLPKLLFLNNFDELYDTDFELIISKLVEVLFDMSVMVNPEVLRAANVAAIHYSKNIPLDQFISCSMVINELSRVDMNSRLDLRQTDYRNQGQLIGWHANNFELVFYDKLADLKQAKISEKKAVENQNAIQLHLFDELANRHPLGVLRMEVRLNKKAKVKRMVRKVDPLADLTFQGLFNQELAQKVLLLYWNEIKLQSQMMSTTTKNTVEILELILNTDSKITSTKALKLAGALSVIKDGHLKRFKSIMNGRSMGSFSRLKRDLAQLDLPVGYQTLDSVGQALKKFEMTKLADYNLN